MDDRLRGIGTSPVPTIGVAYDKGNQNDPAWAPPFEVYAPVARWPDAQTPDDLAIHIAESLVNGMGGQTLDELLTTRNVPDAH